MATSSELKNDPTSSLSPSAENSGVNSPITARPPIFANEPQRSSSISSFVSNTSVGSVGVATYGGRRSLSMVSLDSPRNSIVALDDDAESSKEDVYEPARLHNLPILTSEHTKKGKAVAERVSVSISSDDELDTNSESQEASKQLNTKKPKEKNEPFSFKRDYRLKFGKHVKLNQKSKSDTPHEGKSSPLSTHSDDYEVEPLTLLLKKNKNNSIHDHAPLPLKRKSIFSNDLQLEILECTNKGDPGDIVETSFTRSNSSKLDKKDPHNQSTFSLKEQSNLIRKFNRKWNKDPSVDGASYSPILHNKRRRSDDSETKVELDI